MLCLRFVVQLTGAASLVTTLWPAAVTVNGADCGDADGDEGDAVVVGAGVGGASRDGGGGTWWQCAVTAVQSVLPPLQPLVSRCCQWVHLGAR